MADVLTSKSAGGPESSDLQTVLLAQKTELIGEIASATANQFNNIMMAVTSYAELELKKAPPKERRSLEQVISNAARATSLIQKLLAFSRKQAPSPRPIELNTLVTEVSDLVRQMVGERIELVLSLDPKVQRIKADYVELEQVVLSLALNARDAMATGGKLTVSTGLVKLDKEFIGNNERMFRGKYAMLSVSDTGNALVPEKDHLRHAGGAKQEVRINLVLATARRIVEDANGMIRISSEPGQGTTFKIYFPAMGKEVPEAEESIAPQEGTAARTILVVEDDDAVRVPAAEFLMMEGFKVLQARTGAEAVHVAEQNRSPLDLLITDIVMPEMSGREVARKLIETHPGLKVLYMSGDAGEIAPAGDAEGPKKPILQKPFRLSKLKDKIHEVLGQ